MGLKSCFRVEPRTGWEEVVGENRMLGRVILEAILTICNYKTRLWRMDVSIWDALQEMTIEVSKWRNWVSSRCCKPTWDAGNFKVGETRNGGEAKMESKRDLGPNEGHSQKPIIPLVNTRKRNYLFSTTPFPLGGQDLGMAHLRLWQ